jgi:hypothetical protein
MRLLQFALMMTALVSPMFGANHYVLQGATGTGTGADWTNACVDFTGSCAAASLVRGDTYYVGTGSYVGKTWNTAVSGTLVITIKKAIVADHGTATGWNNAFAAQATFTERNDIETSYWTFDGQVGDYNTGGIGSYGFKDQYSVGNSANCGASNGGVTGAGFLLCGTNITIRYFDCSGYTGTGDFSYPNQAKCIEAYGSTNWTVSHLAMHGCESCLQGGGNGFTVEYSYIYNSRAIGFFHNNIFFCSATNGGTFRYNQVWDYNAEGFFITGNDGPVSNIAIYGNAFWNDGNESNFPRGIEMRADFSYSGILIYNNSFFHEDGGILDQTGTTGGTCSSCQAFNNLSVNAGITLGSGFTSGNNTDDSTTSRFVSVASLYSTNLHLTTSQGPGTSLASPYNADMAGNVRGTDGIWDRGAYEFISGIQTPANLPTPISLPGFGSTNTAIPFNSPFSLTLRAATPTNWNSGTTYTIGQLVCAITSSATCTGVYYVSLQNGNTNQSPTTATTYWQAVTISPTLCMTVTGGLTGVIPTAATPGTCDQSTYTAPVTISGTVTVEWIETQTGQTNSAAKTQTFVIAPFFPAAGVSYVGSRTVQLSVDNGSIPIYTTDGSTPTNNSGACTALNGTATTNGGTITVATTTTVEILPCSGAGVTGTVVTGVFTINSSAQTWYIRTDGGTRFSSHVTAGQCDGKADVAYPGTGTNQHCAFNDFRYMWSDNTTFSGAGTWLMAGSDTVIIRGCTALATQVNPANPYCRLGWDNGTTGAPPNAWCYPNSAGGCFNPPIPAGTASQHTRILGQCVLVGNCNVGNVTTKANLTQFFAGFGMSKSFNLRSTNYVDIQGIYLTTHNATVPRAAWASGTTYPNGPGTSAQVSFSGHNYVSIQAANTGNQPDISPTWWLLADNCISGFSGAYPIACTSSGATDDYAQNGFYTNQMTSNLTLQDVYVDGMGSGGFFGPIGPGIVMTRVHADFNTFGAWNFDDGLSTPDGPGATITASYVTMNHNGCAEEYPVVDPVPMRICYDGSTGDSWSGQNTTLDSFICDHCVSDYNTKDAFIGPHTWTTTLVITNSESIGNEGQSWKWGGFNIPTSVTFLNNLTVANCDRLKQPFPGAPAGYNQLLNTFCRAGGNVTGLVIPTGSTWLFANNTIVTYEPTILQLSCPSALTDNCPSTFNFFNNIVLGYNNPANTYGPLVPGLYYTSGSLGITVNAKNNVEFGVRNNDCPTPWDTGSGNICSDPLLVSEPAQGAIPPESTLDNFNFHLTSGSPAIGAGVTYSALPPFDFYQTPTTTPPVIGAANFAAPPAFHGLMFGTGNTIGTGVIF